MNLLGALRFTALLTTGLSAGIAFAHLLERPNKLTLSAQAYLAVQQHLYEGFGRVAGPIEYVALLATAGSAVVLWRRRGPLALTLAALLSIALALVVWQLHNGPVNAAVARWTPQSLPGDWTTYRDRWENAHAVRAGLYTLALALLSGSVVWPGPARAEIHRTKANGGRGHPIPER